MYNCEDKAPITILIKMNMYVLTVGFAVLQKSSSATDAAVFKGY